MNPGEYMYLFKNNFLIYFWLCWVFVAVKAFLQLQRVGITLQLWCTGFHGSGFPGCGAWALGCTGFSSCSSRALQCRLSSCGACAQLPCSRWGLPGSGTELVSPAPASGFSTTEPQRSPTYIILDYGFLQICAQEWVPGSYGSSIFSFLRKIYIVLHSCCTHLHLAQQRRRIIPFSTEPLQYCLQTFDDGHSDQCEVILHGSFDLHYL